MTTIGPYDLLKSLGSGTYSNVFACRARETNKIYALKFLKPSCMNVESYFEDFKHEAKVLAMLDHPNTIKMIDCDFSAFGQTENGEEFKTAYISLEHAGNMRLYDYIQHSGKFSEELARYFFKQLCNALVYLQSKGISHCDIKNENITIDADYNLRLVDYGFAHLKPKIPDRRGSYGCMAPEIVSGSDYYGHVADIFASGVALFQMVSGKRPFAVEASMRDALYQNFAKNNTALFWYNRTKEIFRNEKQFSKDFKHLINIIFSIDPFERPSISDLLKHPWLSGPVPSPDEIKAELKDRRNRIARANLNDNEEVPDAVPNPSVFMMSRVHRGIDDDDEEISKNESETTVDRKAQIYVPELACLTQFFSKSSIEDLFDTLGCFIEKMSATYSFSSSEYQAVFDVSYGDKMTTVLVNILSAGTSDDQQCYCIEALLQKGESEAHAQAFQEMVRFFGGHSNATEPDYE